MEQRPLGRTGVSVSKLCLGAMMFGDWGTKDHGESIRIIHRALDAGINFIDTADVYSHGESEVIVGEALAGGRRELDAAEQLAELADRVEAMVEAVFREEWGRIAASLIAMAGDRDLAEEYA